MNRADWTATVNYWGEEREEAREAARVAAAARNHSNLLRALSKVELCSAAIDAMYQIEFRGEVAS